MRPLTRLLLSLGAVLLLVNACTNEEDPRPGGPFHPSPPIEVTPDSGDAGSISLDGGDVVLSDGGTFAAKPSCSGTSCAGACPDGGVICAGNCGFLTAVSYALPGTPRDIASGDLNGDGADDLVTVNSVGNTTAVLLNRKAGLFQTPTLLPAGAAPSSVLLADVTGDQKLDVLAANSSSLMVFRGKGDGSFPTATYTSVGQSIDDMAIGSFGGSQRVALLGGSGDKLLVLKSNGNGSFAPPVSARGSHGPQRDDGRGLQRRWSSGPRPHPPDVYRDVGLVPVGGGAAGQQRWHLPGPALHARRGLASRPRGGEARH